MTKQRKFWIVLGYVALIPAFLIYGVITVLEYATKVMAGFFGCVLAPFFWLAKKCDRVHFWDLG